MREPRRIEPVSRDGASSAAPAASFAAVSHHYGDIVALDEVTTLIPAGCVAGLIGPDGVGKSTLLALISGVKRIQAGTVHALGGDMADRTHRSECYGRIACMPQGLDRNLYPLLSVAENLDFFGRLFGQGKVERGARFTDLLASTGLDTPVRTARPQSCRAG